MSSREERAVIHGRTTGVLLTIFLDVVGFILTLILGDKEARRGARSVVWFVILITIILILVGCLV